MVPGTLRKFLYYYINAEINIDNLWVPLTLRANNNALMESFLDTHNFSDTDLYRLNLCCIYLKVELLSEICNPEGCNAGRCADGCECMPDATAPIRCTVQYL